MRILENLRTGMGSFVAFLDALEALESPTRATVIRHVEVGCGHMRRRCA
jgi:hypothetical protein